MKTSWCVSDDKTGGTDRIKTNGGMIKENKVSVLVCSLLFPGSVELPLPLELELLVAVLRLPLPFHPGWGFVQEVDAQLLFALLAQQGSREQDKGFKLVSS